MGLGAGTLVATPSLGDTPFGESPGLGALPASIGEPVAALFAGTWLGAPKLADAAGFALSGAPLDGEKPPLKSLPHRPLGSTICVADCGDSGKSP